MDPFAFALPPGLHTRAADPALPYRTGTGDVVLLREADGARYATLAKPMTIGVCRKGRGSERHVVTSDGRTLRVVTNPRRVVGPADRPVPALCVVEVP